MLLLLRVGHYVRHCASREVSAPRTTGSAVPSERYHALDGTGWSNGGTANTARRYLTGFGIQTAGVACGGFAPNASNASEEYNGSSWTSGGAMNTAKNHNPLEKKTMDTDCVCFCPPGISPRALRGATEQLLRGFRGFSQRRSSRR